MIYKYKANNKENKVVSGLVEASNEIEVEQILADKDLKIISIELESETVKKDKFQIVIGGVKPKEVVIFSRQFAVMVAANVAIVQALKLLTEQTENIKFKMAISEIADDIDEGSRLSDALAKKDKIFSSFYVSVVRAGETSGKLDEVLNYLADELEKEYDMTSKIKGAMIYPAFVVTMMIGAGIFMMIFVVPKLTDVIAESGGELPMATKILIGVSDILIGYWWALIIAVIGLVVLYGYLNKNPETKRYLDILKLKLPIFGKLIQRIHLVRFTRSMQTLIVGGVNISKSLAIAEDVIDNSVYKDLIKQTKKEIEDGNSISTAFLASEAVPTMVSQMMSIGEKTGKLDLVLEKITDFYTREIDNIVANLMTLMEPLIMVSMGVAVGIMVAAIMMPMYNMANNF